MTAILDTPLLGGTFGLAANPESYAAQRISESKNQALVVPNASQALISGGQNRVCFSKLLFVVSSGPSNLTIRTIDGTSTTLTGLTTGAVLNLDVQFTLATWTGTATAAGTYTE
jgi:hypothetical protein